MQALINKSAIDCLPERQRVALISLLVDDDPTIYHLVKIKKENSSPAASKRVNGCARIF